jgi:hypothetical protein
MRIFLMIITLLIAGCGFRPASSAPEGSTVVASVGSPILTWETGGFWSDQKRSELIFSGVQDDQVKMSYREFRRIPQSFGWYASPAFTQELTYDLAKSPIVSFQNARLSIKSADNSRIEAVVLTAPVSTD